MTPAKRDKARIRALEDQVAELKRIADTWKEPAHINRLADAIRALLAREEP